MTQRRYRMSGAGDCPRALSAEKLGYKGELKPFWLEQAADEGKWHEERMVNQLREMGYPVRCRQKEFTIDRDGYQLIGHIDGVVTVDGEDMLLEIKSMSQYEFDRWKRGGFLEFLSYADQITCYMEASGMKKALYLIKNRSSGYIDGLQDGAIDPHKILYSTPSDPNIIFSKLSAVEASLAKNELYPAEYNPAELECRRCFYRNQICVELNKQVLSEATEAELLRATKMIKEGYAEITAGELLYNEGKATLANFLGVTSPDKKSSYKANKVTASRFKSPAYGDKISYPKGKVESIVPEEYLELVRETKPASWNVVIHVEKEEPEEAGE